MGKVTEPDSVYGINLLYAQRNIKELFRTANSELRSVNDWCLANKLTLNIDKTKYIFP